MRKTCELNDAYENNIYGIEGAPHTNRREGSRTIPKRIKIGGVNGIKKITLKNIKNNGSDLIS